MRRTLIIAAAVSGLALASSAHAGFSLAYTRAVIASTNLDSVIVRALNDGTGTGTKISALDLDVSVLAGDGGGNAYFFVDDTDLDGTADQVQISNAGNGVPNGKPLAPAPFIRIGTAADTFIVAATPTKDVVQPNPWLNGVTGFKVTATTLNAPVANTGTGALIARLVIDHDAGLKFNAASVLGGDSGSAVHPSNDQLDPIGGGNPTAFKFGVASGGTFTFSASAIGTASVSGGGTDPGLDTYTLNVDFKNLASSNLTFSFNTNDTGGTIDTSGAVLPAGVTLSAAGTTISGTVAGNVRGTFDITGIKLLNAASGSDDTATIHLVAVPEPASLSLLAGVGLMALRRRK